MKKYWNYLRASVLWSRAVSFCARDDNINSMRALDSIYSMFNQSKPSPSAIPEINMLCALVAYNMKDYQLSIESVRVLLQQLRDTHSYSVDDVNYIKYYCRVILESISYRTNPEIFLESKDIDVSYNVLRFDKVRKSIRKNFPISGPVPSEQFFV
jgi:hypothetical protein